MRLKITLWAKKETFIPINYQYLLSAVIYNLLSKSNLDFATSLHNGIHINTKKKFKWFTFSWFQIPKGQRIIFNSTMKILPGQFSWFISSVWHEFIQYLVNGIFELGEIKIQKESFQIVQVETLPDIIINKDNKHCRNVISETKNIYCKKFSCLSPIVVTTKKEYNGKLAKYYYRPSDDIKEISQKIRQNLINKYKTFYKVEPQNTSLEFFFDEKYIKKPDAERKITYKTTEIKAIMCPFTVCGSQELIKFGYECGFGELNSCGFGMVKEI